MAIHDATQTEPTVDRLPFHDRVAAALRRIELALRRSIRHLRQAPVAARTAQRRAGRPRANGTR